MAANSDPLSDPLHVVRRDRAEAMAAIFHGPGSDFELRPVAPRQPGRGEILVKVTCATICGSDLHTWHGRRQEPTPGVLGHEIIGKIAAMGPEAPRVDLSGQKLDVGSRVTWSIAASCGECFFCRRDLPQKCEHLFKYGHCLARPGDECVGGFATHCLLRAGTGIAVVPDELPDPLAAMANCAGATVAAAHRIIGPVREQVVVVVGCGVLGLLACAMAAESGAARIIACDPNPQSRERAKRFGATSVAAPGDLQLAVGSASSGRGADVAFEFSGTGDGVRATLEVPRIGGRVLLAGTTTPGCSFSLDPERVVRKMLTICGLHNYHPADLPVALAFLAAASAKYPMDDFHAGCHRLDAIGEAFRHADKAPGRRVAIRP